VFFCVFRIPDDGQQNPVIPNQGGLDGQYMKYTLGGGGKRLLGKSEYRGEDNIKMDVKEM
jgi:hypothetical protein